VSLGRLITAALILPLLILYILKLPPAWYAGLLAVISAVALMEFYGMYGVSRVLRVAGIIAGVALIVASHQTGRIAEVLAVSLLLIASVRLFAKRTPGGALKDLAPVTTGLLYVPLLLSYQLPLVKARPGLVVFLLGAVWMADAAALYVGKALGRRKLYEAMSPNKTVAGGLGSLAGGAAGAAIMKAFLLPDVPLWTALWVGAVLGAVTVVGDLVESMFKRDAGVKDSGVLFPGHGGVLDKIDGSVFAGPVLYWILRALGMLE
jgi:phosphatidate cytidylyltransferase